MIGDDDLEPELAGAPNFLDRRDAAVDGDDEATAVLGQALERLPADAVALVEAARQMPVRICPQLPQMPSTS